MAQQDTNVFNQDIANNYINQHRYFELANYLRQYNTGSKEDREAGYQQIVAAEQEGRRYSGMMNHATNDQRWGIDFMETLRQNGVFTRNQDQQVINPFGNAYLNAVKNLGNVGDQTATTVSIKFKPRVIKRYVDIPIFGKVDWLVKDDVEDDNAYDLFLKQNGLTNEDMQKLSKDDNSGVKVTTNAGVTTLDIKKTSRYFPRFIMGLKDVDTNHDTINGVKDPEAKGEKRYYIAGKDAQGNIISTNKNSFDGSSIVSFNNILNKFLPDKREFGQSDIDPELKGYVLGDYADYITGIQNIINQAQNLEKEANGGEDGMISQSVESSDSMSAWNDRLNTMVNNGMMSREDYAAALEMEHNRLNQAVLASDLHDHEVYWYGYTNNDEIDNKSESAVKVDNQQDITYLNNVVRKAASGASGYTISYNMAMSGDKFGKLITVTLPNKDDDKPEKAQSVVTEDGANKDVKVITLFVPDFDGNEAEQSFRKDTRTRASMELNQMKTYDYNLDIPQEGTLSHRNGIFTLTNKSGEVKQITDDDAQGLINRKFIQDDILEEAQNTFYNPSTGASLYQDAQGNVNQNAYNNILNRANQLIDYRAAQAMQELYPGLIDRANEYKQAGLNYKDLEDNYKQEQESIAAYIKQLLTQQMS